MTLKPGLQLHSYETYELLFRCTSKLRLPFLFVNGWISISNKLRTWMEGIRKENSFGSLWFCIYPIDASDGSSHLTLPRSTQLLSIFLRCHFFGPFWGRMLECKWFLNFVPHGGTLWYCRSSRHGANHAGVGQGTFGPVSYAGLETGEQTFQYRCSAQAVLLIGNDSQALGRCAQAGWEKMRYRDFLKVRGVISCPSEFLKIGPKSFSAISLCPSKIHGTIVFT